jgi:hypothetical protein
VQYLTNARRKSGHIKAFNNASRTVRMGFPSTDPEIFDPFHSLEAFITVILEFQVPFRLIFLADEESSQHTLIVVGWRLEVRSTKPDRRHLIRKVTRPSQYLSAPGGWLRFNSGALVSLGGAENGSRGGLRCANSTARISQMGAHPVE